MDLRIVVDQPYVESGGRLSGKLLVTINSNKNFHASDLLLYFRGKEYTAVRYTETTGSGDKRRSRTRTAKTKSQLMRLNYQNERTMGDNVFRQGSHEIPFSFNLPSGLPSSISVSSGSDTAKIEYCLRAVILNSGIIQNYEARLPVKVVAEGEPIRTVPWRTQPNYKKITTCGFFKKGDITYGAKFQDIHLVPGQQLKVKVAMFNDSIAPVNNIVIRVRQKTDWWAGGHHSSHKWVVCSSSFQQTGKISALDKSELKQSRDNKQIRRRERYQEILRQLEKPGGVLKLPPIPFNADNTFQGASMKVTHDVKIEINTETGYTNPDFTVPIRITRAAPPNQQQLEDCIMPVAAAASIPVADAYPAYPVASAEPIYDIGGDYSSSDALASVPTAPLKPFPLPATNPMKTATKAAKKKAPRPSVDAPPPATNPTRTTTKKKVPNPSMDVSLNPRVKTANKVRGHGKSPPPATNPTAQPVYNSIGGDCNSSAPPHPVPTAPLEASTCRPPATAPMESFSAKRRPPPATNPKYANQLPYSDDRDAPSVDQLVEKMRYSINDLFLLQERIHQQAWKGVFAPLTAQDYGRILEQVHLEVHHVDVAVLLASQVQVFTCQHVVQALPHTSDSTRCLLVEQLLPFCQDVQENHGQIIGQLESEWDQIIVEAALQSVLAGGA